MSNKWDEMMEALREAENTIIAADSIANGMARMLCSRLRNINPDHAANLKRELRNFNIHTGKWGE